MPMRPYYTLCIFDTEQNCWFDEFGSYDRKEVVAETDYASAPRKHIAIIKHDDTAAAMLAARDALPLPKRQG